MSATDFNISEFLFLTDPALWRCPIQFGIPFLLSRVTDLLLYIAALVLLFGIILSAYKHMTAFGNEDKAKQARLTLIWTVGGAFLIIFSSLLIGTVSDYFITDDKSLFFDKKNITAECTPKAE